MNLICDLCEDVSKTEMNNKWKVRINLFTYVSDQDRVSPYIINNTMSSDENDEKYHSMVQYQILRTNIIRIVWLTVRRITLRSWK